jgi:hypothetical protein
MRTALGRSGSATIVSSITGMGVAPTKPGSATAIRYDVPTMRSRGVEAITGGVQGHRPELSEESGIVAAATPREEPTTGVATARLMRRAGRHAEGDRRVYGHPKAASRLARRGSGRPRGGVSPLGEASVQRSALEPHRLRSSSLPSVAEYDNANGCYIRSTGARGRGAASPCLFAKARGTAGQRLGQGPAPDHSVDATRCRWPEDSPTNKANIWPLL